MSEQFTIRFDRKISNNVIEPLKRLIKKRDVSQEMPEVENQNDESAIYDASSNNDTQKINLDKENRTAKTQLITKTTINNQEIISGSNANNNEANSQENENKTDNVNSASGTAATLTKEDSASLVNTTATSDFLAEADEKTDKTDLSSTATSNLDSSNITSSASEATNQQLEKAEERENYVQNTTVAQIENDKTVTTQESQSDTLSTTEATATDKMNEKESNVNLSLAESVQRISATKQQESTTVNSDSDSDKIENELSVTSSTNSSPENLQDLITPKEGGKSHTEQGILNSAEYQETYSISTESLIKNEKSYQNESTDLTSSGASLVDPTTNQALINDKNKQSDVSNPSSVSEQTNEKEIEQESNIVNVGDSLIARTEYEIENESRITLSSAETDQVDDIDSSAAQDFNDLVTNQASSNGVLIDGIALSEQSNEKEAKPIQTDSPTTEYEQKKSNDLTATSDFLAEADEKTDKTDLSSTATSNLDSSNKKTIIIVNEDDLAHVKSQQEETTADDSDDNTMDYETHSKTSSDYVTITDGEDEIADFLLVATQKEDNADNEETSGSSDDLYTISTISSDENNIDNEGSGNDEVTFGVSEANLVDAATTETPTTTTTTTIKKVYPPKKYWEKPKPSTSLEQHEEFYMNFLNYTCPNLHCQYGHRIDSNRHPQCSCYNPCNVRLFIFPFKFDIYTVLYLKIKFNFRKNDVEKVFVLLNM